jgi:hypothetical protein
VRLFTVYAPYVRFKDTRSESNAMMCFGGAAGPRHVPALRGVRRDAGMPRCSSTNVAFESSKFCETRQPHFRCQVQGLETRRFQATGRLGGTQLVKLPRV